MAENIAKQIAEEGEEEIVSSFMAGIIPKIAPMMKQASRDFEGFLSGEDDKVEKTIVIRKFAGKPPSVMVFSNNRTFHIECGEGGKVNVFKAGKDSVLFMFTAEEFVSLLLSGKMKK